MVDLNSLISADSPLYLVLAFGINDAGDIVGQAVEKSTGDLHAFLAKPRREVTNAAPRTNDEATPVVLPENVRILLRRRLPTRSRLGP